jgi:protocatechuate 3,4-dioxygenase beta subunit
MKRAIVVALVLAAGCGGDETKPAQERVARTCTPTAGEVETVTAAPADTPSRIRMGPGMTLKPTKATLAAARIGKPLVVTGVVTGADCAPLAGATVTAWQTNGRGRYGPGEGGDRCCYLTGTARTDAKGRYTFDTVMPKGYDGGPSHIHFEAGHPDAEGLVAELIFDAPTARAEYDITLQPR